VSSPIWNGAAPSEPPRPSATAFESVVLVLQGGGALGAYQAGVYQALSERGIEPTWVSGISIGAINSAIIAGNPPEQRVAKLRAFWELVTAQHAVLTGFWNEFWTGGQARSFANQLAAGSAALNGVKGFFSPRYPPPPLQPNGTAAATSWYDTAELRATLGRLVDFDRINARQVRFSVGAVNVRTGNFAYFDNAKEKIRPEHVMASGALPPAFPAVVIDGESYWDGGLVSNTPLDWVLSSRLDLNTLVLQVDLWSARGALPRDLAEVAVRMKEIQYSSRTRAATDSFRRAQMLRADFNDLLAQLPPELAATPQAKRLARESDAAAYNIVQLVYKSPTYEAQSKDFEFSRQTMEDHWRAGYDDAAKTLAHRQVLELPKGPGAVQVFDFLRAADQSAAAAKA
jgi:NTE family protein